MREFCGTAAEYLECRTLPYDVESGGREIKLEGGLLNLFGSSSSESEQKHIYRPLA